MILVVAEQRQGKLNRATWEAIAAAQQAGGPIAVVVLGSGLDAAAQELAAAAVGEVADRRCARARRVHGRRVRRRAARR